MLGEAGACLGCESRSTAAELVRLGSVLLARLPPRLAAGLAWPATCIAPDLNNNGCHVLHTAAQSTQKHFLEAATDA